MKTFMLFSFLTPVLSVFIYIGMKKDWKSFFTFLLLASLSGWIWWTWIQGEIADPLQPIRLFTKASQSIFPFLK
ncbi:hypothetical protein LC040_14030 [Bacillus tianshenii]|nr:hypothetical protein LC040_14030 [Bacillus tianshenii]